MLTDLFSTLAIVIIPIATLIWMRLFIIPPRRFAVVERLGHFRSILMPGAYLLWPFIEYLKSVTWSYTNADGYIELRSQTVLSLDNVQMDLPPLKCLTKDQIIVTVDGTLMYHVSNPQLAVYGTDDVLNLLFQCAQQGIRNCMSTILASDTQGCDNRIGKLVQQYVNEKMGDRGVHCDEFIIQDIAMDPKILEANQAIYTRARQSQMEMEQQLAQHQKAMAALEHRTQKERAEQQLLMAAKEFELKTRAREANAKAEIEKLQAESFQRAGYNVDQVLELHRIKAMSKLAASGNKIIYAPLPFYESAQRGALPAPQ